MILHRSHWLLRCIANVFAAYCDTVDEQIRSLTQKELERYPKEDTTRLLKFMLGGGISGDINKKVKKSKKVSSKAEKAAAKKTVQKKSKARFQAAVAKQCVKKAQKACQSKK